MEILDLDSNLKFEQIHLLVLGWIYIYILLKNDEIERDKMNSLEMRDDKIISIYMYQIFFKKPSNEQ